jgi:hypothetical protein
MGSLEIFKGTDNPQMQPIFYLDMIRMIDEGRVQAYMGGGATRASNEMVWSSVTPEMIPMPGTPDFCDFRMDGAV